MKNCTFMFLRLLNKILRHFMHNHKNFRCFPFFTIYIRYELVIVMNVHSGRVTLFNLPVPLILFLRVQYFIWRCSYFDYASMVFFPLCINDTGLQYFLLKILYIYGFRDKIFQHFPPLKYFEIENLISKFSLRIFPFNKEDQTGR